MAGKNSKPTILIVDDDPYIRKMLAEVLGLEGYPYETATNGQEALEALDKSGPRLILLDLLMPVLDGRGVMNWLRAAQRSARGTGSCWSGERPAGSGA